MIRNFSLILLAAAGAACHNTPEQPPYGIPAPPGAICTMEARPAISVQVVDAQTGEPVTGAVIVIVRDGLYADTSQARATAPTGVRSAALAYERAGTYAVLVRHPAYREWQRTNVAVTRDECHVKTVVLRAELRN